MKNMPNKRMIHYSLFENYQFSKLTDREKLIYIGLIVIADDEGRFKADPNYIKSKLFPYEVGSEENRVSDISRSINKLNGLQLVKTWEHNGEQVGEHPNWKKYQNLREERIKPSVIPPPNVRQVSAKCRRNISKDNISKDNISKDNIATPLQEVVNHYILLKGWSGKVPYSRLTRPGKELLELCAGDVSLAKHKLDIISKWAALKKLDWAIETVMKRWGDIDMLPTEAEKKPYYDGNPMYQKFGKWFCIVDGEHKEFADSESKIIWK